MAIKDKNDCGKNNFDDWWEDRIIGEKVLIIIGFVVLGAGLLFLLGLVVKGLWNWLMPEIFGLKQITYWQAWGLMVLSAILFKPMNMKSESSKNDRKRKRELRRYMKEDNSEEKIQAVENENSNES
jgi:hypothetical protein